MKRGISILRIMLLIVAALSAPVALAAEVDFVTYAPAQQTGGGNQHVNSLTVGSAYNSTTPTDGTALIVGPLGIGTTSPNYKLVSALSNNSTASVPPDSAVGLLILNADATTSNWSGIAFSQSGAAGWPGDAAGIFAQHIGRSSGHRQTDLGFFTVADGATATEKMRISGSGAIGIGTATPQSTLDLGDATSGRSLVWGGVTGAAHYNSIGSAYSSSALSLLHGLKLSTAADQYQYSTATLDRAGIRLGDASTGDISFFNAASSAQTVGNAFDHVANTKLIIKGDGKVGIGTTSPGAGTKLHVHDSLTASQYITTNGANPAVLWFGNNYDNAGARRWAAIGVTGTDDALRFTGGNSSLSDADTHMIITNTGLVGIGTINPSAPLEVQLDDATTNAVSRVLSVRKSTTGTAAAGLGPQIALGAERTDGVLTDIARIGAFWEGTPSAGSGEDASLTFSTILNGSFGERMRLTSDGAMDFPGIATASAPAVSGSGRGRIYYDSTDNHFKISENGGAYRNLNAPDYDSGWVSDSDTASHRTDFTHNFGSFPSRVEVWFTNSLTSGVPTSYIFPITWSWEKTSSGNPVTIWVSTTEVLLYITNTQPLHSAWDLSWHTYHTGYWRVKCWK